MLFITMTKPVTNGLTGRVCGFCRGRRLMRRKFLYAQTGRRFLRLPGKAGDGACYERPKHRGARPGRGAYRGVRLASGRLGWERRKAGTAFDLDGILRSIRKAGLDSGAALAIVKVLKERGLIDIDVVPAGKGSVSFLSETEINSSSFSSVPMRRI
jgi:hypothetical protein